MCEWWCAKGHREDVEKVVHLNEQMELYLIISAVWGECPSVYIVLYEHNVHSNNRIIIDVMHISMFRNYSFNFERNITKHGRNMERRGECNIAEPKFELKSFHPRSCVFYGHGHI